MPTTDDRLDGLAGRLDDYGEQLAALVHHGASDARVAALERTVEGLTARLDALERAQQS